MPWLSVPRALVFTVVAAAPVALACGDTSAPDAAPVADAHSDFHCIPNGLALDGGIDAPPCPMYADENDECPFGCTPVG